MSSILDTRKPTYFNPAPDIALCVAYIRTEVPRIVQLVGLQAILIAQKNQQINFGQRKQPIFFCLNHSNAHEVRNGNILCCTFMGLLGIRSNIKTVLVFDLIPDFICFLKI